LLRAARRGAPAGAVIVPAPAVPVPASVSALVPLLAGREGTGGHGAVAYVCEGGACRLPTASAAELERELQKLSKSGR
jgi:uncharacterized protein YyaL (SSP411 family)